MIRQLARAATPAATPPELTRLVLAPLERQAELLEQALQRQSEFEREVVGRMLAPLDQLLDTIAETAAAMRTQSQAFDAAATSLKRASEVLEMQAGLLDRASRSIREPTELLRRS